MRVLRALLRRPLPEIRIHAYNDEGTRRVTVHIPARRGGYLMVLTHEDDPAISYVVQSDIIMQMAGPDATAVYDG